MPNYKKMYFRMFNGITDVIDELEKDKGEITKVVEKLKQIQIDGEEMYIDTYDEYPEDEEDKCEE